MNTGTYFQAIYGSKSCENWSMWHCLWHVPGFISKTKMIAIETMAFDQNTLYHQVIKAIFFSNFSERLLVSMCTADLNYFDLETASNSVLEIHF